MAGTPRTVACPRCGVQAEYSQGNRWRPFCSERCRLIDLGNWASEAYRVPASLESRDPEVPPSDA